MNRARVGEQGQALVELAFVIPLVLLFLFAIIDFGLALNQQNSETNIANIAVREAAIVNSASFTAQCNGTSEPTLQLWAQCEAKADGTPTPTVCVADVGGATPSGTYNQGDPIKVWVTSSFSWLHLISSQVGGLSSSIGASATMRYEGNLSNASSTFLPAPSGNCGS